MRVVIVGAGAVGLTCALALAERGANVLVIERETSAEPSRSASRAAAGMLGPLSEAALESARAPPALLELGLESLALWRDLGARLNLSTFPLRGALWRASPATLAAVEALARAHGALAQPVAGGLRLPGEGALDPREALAALEAALAAHGGAVRRGAQAREADGGGVVLADGARVAADAVILATGLGAPDIAPPDAPPLTAMKGQMLEVAASAPGPGEVLRGEQVYAVGRAGGRAVIGATMEPGRADIETDPAILALLAARAGAIEPALADAPRLRAWAGVRPMSADWAPRIGRCGAVIVARGHSRNGWLLAPVTAAIVRAHVFAEPLASLWAKFAP